VVLSLGLGLAVLAAVGQIDANLRAAIQRDLPQVAPSYFFVDIQPDQLSPSSTASKTTPPSAAWTPRRCCAASSPASTANARRCGGRSLGDPGRPGRDLHHPSPPEDEIVDGAWWPDDYDGPPLVAFAAEEAMEIGLAVGDEITVNILGRDITATIAALARWSSRMPGSASS
jgi:putative ABC transport system permease protein